MEMMRTILYFFCKYLHQLNEIFIESYFMLTQYNIQGEQANKAKHHPMKFKIENTLKVYDLCKLDLLNSDHLND